MSDVKKRKTAQALVCGFYTPLFITVVNAEKFCVTLCVSIIVSYVLNHCHNFYSSQIVYLSRKGIMHILLNSVSADSHFSVIQLQL